MGLLTATIACTAAPVAGAPLYTSISGNYLVTYDTGATNPSPETFVMFPGGTELGAVSVSREIRGVYP
jgi:hypothetical protein